MTVQNFQVLRPSRKRLRVGDVFTMRLPDGDFIFGRVISTEARWCELPVEEAGTQNLVYVFKARSRDKAIPDRRELQTDRLLVPPQLVNRLGWSRGYFETLGNLPFEPGETLAINCFESAARGQQWFDENSNRLDRPHPPVGQWGAGNHRTVEDAVCRALGIPLSPDD